MLVDANLSLYLFIHGVCLSLSQANLSQYFFRVYLSLSQANDTIQCIYHTESQLILGLYYVFFLYKRLNIQPDSVNVRF